MPDLPPLGEMDGDRILVRGHDLADDLLGKVGFTEVLFLDMRGRLPTTSETRVLDSLLVSIVEHGLTPSAVATRLVLDAAPEAVQGAIAAGLLAAGSQFLGSMREVAIMLRDLNAAAGEDREGAARRHAAEAVAVGARIPGFGHNIHQAEDPRVAALLTIAREAQIRGAACETLEALAAALAEARPGLIVNVAGAIGAIALDLGFTPDEARSLAVVGRCGGLAAHASAERHEHRARTIWETLQ